VFGMIGVGLVMFWCFGQKNSTELIKEVLVTSVDTVYIHKKNIINNKQDTAMLITDKKKGESNKIVLEKTVDTDKISDKKEQVLYETNGVNVTGYKFQEVLSKTIQYFRNL
jgi:hypothetical protein